MVQVKLFGNLRQHAGQATVTASGETVGELLLHLCQSFPALETAIFVGGRLRPHVRVMINGRDIELADGLGTPMSEDDQVAIFPPIAGGGASDRVRPAATAPGLAPESAAIQSLLTAGE